MNKQTVSDHRNFVSLAGVLDNFVRYACHCSDPGLLLQHFLASICETREAGSCLAIRISTKPLDSPVLTCSGFNASQCRQIRRLMDSGNLQEENFLQKLEGVPQLFLRELNIHLSVLVDTDSQGYKTCFFLGRKEQPFRFSKNDNIFLKTLISVLEMALQNLDLQQHAHADFQNILAAKQQWESTVDVLDVLICLLDRHGKVFRANKTLEQWNLGNVRNLDGVDVHELLHPDCHDPKCILKLNWLNLWNSPDYGTVNVCEFHDSLNQCEFKMTLLRGGIKDDEHDDFSTLVIEDTSERKWAFNVLEEYSKELYSRIQHQSLEINEISTNLQSRIHEHLQVRKSLELTEERLLSLSGKLLTAQEEERKRIAAELHDGVGQSISAIKFNLESLLVTRWSANEEQQNKQHMERIINRLRDTVEEVRRISMGLRPSMIDELGLLITIQWLCRTFTQDFPEIQLEQDFHINEAKIAENQRVSIFRITQEALNNIAKYSRADKVTIQLTTTRNTTVLSIEDNGIGFQADASKLSSGFGLCSMKERAKLSGGKLTIHTSPGHGALIQSVW